MRLQDRGTTAMKVLNNFESCSNKCVRLVTETANGKGRDSLEEKLANVVATREAQFVTKEHGLPSTLW